MTIAGDAPAILLRERAEDFGFPFRKENALNDRILSAIDDEIAKLREARALLVENASPAARKTTKKDSASSPPAPKRTLSAEARRAIAAAQHRRWAKVKGRKKAATPATRKKAAVK
jgi:hypothetical protein